MSLTFLVGSFLNAYVMSKMKIKSQGKGFGARAIVSTIIGESFDSIIFFPIAFWGIIPADKLLLMIITQALLKTIYEIIILPVTKIIVNYVKKTDGSDVYDDDISYNVLKIQDI